MSALIFGVYDILIAYQIWMSSWEELMMMMSYILSFIVF